MVSGVASGLVPCQNLSESFVHFNRGQFSFWTAVEMPVPHKNLNIKEEKTRGMLDYGDTDGDGALKFKAIAKMQRN